MFCRRFVLVFSLLLSGAAFAQKPLHNADVVSMVRKGDSVVEIVNRINGAPSGYQMDFEDVKALRQDGVPEVVIRAMFTRQTGGSTRLEGNSEASPVAAAPAITSSAAPDASTPTRRRSEGNGWALGKGRLEVGVRIGGGSFVNNGFGGTNMWSAGVSMGVGITRHVAALGEYAYSDFRGGSILPLGVAHDKLHDAIGGVRIGLGSRVDPYFFAGGGMAHLNGEAITLLGPGKLSWTKPAVAFGGGINFTIRHGIGVQWDTRLVRPTDFVWYARSTGGLYFRF